MITFLGNVIDSVSMTVTLPKEKLDHIKDECLCLQKKNKTSIINSESSIYATFLCPY
jgi:hypothetical protein